MRKFKALLLAVLLTLVVANSLYFFTEVKSSPPSETVVVSRVIDGDTLDTLDGRRLRLANINTPERGKYGYEQAKAFLQQYENHSIQAVLEGTDNRGIRYVSRLYTVDGEYLNLQMVEQGLASKAWVSDAETKAFAAAEAQAIKEERGLWKSSPYAHCITLFVDAQDERATIENACANVSIKNWWIKDESRQIYTFATTQVSTTTLHTGKGTNTLDDLYWGKNEHVWNNDRDTAYLFDSQNLLVSAYVYGY